MPTTPAHDFEQRLLYHSERIHGRMQEAARLATNEAELRRHVEPYIEEALRELYDLSFQQIRSERRSENGQLDVAYGGVVVEFEHNMGTGARRRRGAQQALDYLAAERERGDIETFSAVVTDGRQWGFLIADDETDVTLSLFGVSPSDPTERFVWRPHSVAGCRRFLELVGSHRQIPVTGQSLVAAFGRGSALARELVSRLVESVQNRSPSDRTDTLYLEWRRALEVAYGSLDDRNAAALRAIREAYNIAIVGSLGEFVFALHTYFALTARLVAAETLAISVGESQSRPSQWSSLPDEDLAVMLQRLEQGNVPEGLSIANLLEGDVFSWYTERLEGAVNMLDAIRRLCSGLDRFAFPRLAYGAGPTADLLRDLYQGLTTRQLRKALGEFLTPHWLAQATIDAAKRNGADITRERVLDCTCGTGTFLRPLVSARLQQLRMKHQGTPPVHKVQEVLDSVVGIDINPVAVVASRMNYLMALGELATTGDLYLPVWLADSVLLPSPPAVQTEFVDRPELAGRRFVELLTSLDEPFVVPEEFLSQGALARLTALLRQAIGAQYSTDEFQILLESDLGPNADRPVTADADEWDNAVAVLRALYEQLFDLHAAGRNEVWAEVIENRFAPLFLGRFGLVVGNPPWLSWKKLPDAWKVKAEPLWRDYGLFRVPAVPGVSPLHSLQSSDLAVLVTSVALERYLRPHGTLAFVTPKGLINGDAANRAFRHYRLDSRRDAHARRAVDVPFKVLEVMDFGEVQPFSPEAANVPIVIVLRPGEETTFPIPGSRWRRRSSPLPDVTWDKMRAGYLTSQEVVWSPISTYNASPLAWWLPGEIPLRRPPSSYTFGMGFNTRGALGVYHVELRSSVVPQSGMIRIANSPEGGVTQVSQRVGNVNARLVVPVVRGQNIRPFSIEPEGYVLLPHDPDDRARPLSQAEMQSAEYRGAYEFLSNFRQVLLDRPPYQQFRPSEAMWWHVGSCEQLGAHGTILCVQEIADPPSAAVLRPIWDERLGRTVLPIPNHKCVFYRTSDEEEAYYLAGMINSRAAQQLLQRFANFTAISPQTIRYLPIPPFDLHNAQHRRIAELSRLAHGASQVQRPAIVETLNEVVDNLLDVTPQRGPRAQPRSPTSGGKRRRKKVL